jgi:hypothetical protein
MELTEAITALRHARLPIRYVNPACVDIAGELPPYEHYYHHGPAEGLRAWADLSSLAKSNDQANQVPLWQRSNYYVLRREFPDVEWIDRAYSNVSHLGAYVDSLAATDGLIENLVTMAETSGTYDENDEQTREMEEMSAEWDSDIGRFDVPAELESNYGEGPADVWRTMTTAQTWEVFEAACEVSGHHPEHTGLDIRWNNAIERALPYVVKVLTAYDAVALS